MFQVVLGRRASIFSCSKRNLSPAPFIVVEGPLRLGRDAASPERILALLTSTACGAISFAAPLQGLRSLEGLRNSTPSYLWIGGLTSHAQKAADPGRKHNPNAQVKGTPPVPFPATSPGRSFAWTFFPNEQNQDMP